MGQALYRKYRSRALGEVIGQEHITTTLAHALESGRISHAYLFTGPRGTGKTSIARILAHEINKLPYADTPHLDIIEIDAASNRRIDDIRDLRDKVHITPISAKYKVYIIDEVHMLTGESFNALLKTLEEPPAHVVFILATTEVHKLPATIISRTQRFAFRAADPQKLTAHLKNIATKEGVDITQDALELIAEHGDGSFRDSVSLLDQLANSTDGQVTSESIEQMLGLAPRKTIGELTQALIAGDYHKASELLQALEAKSTAAALMTQLAKTLAAEAPKHPALYQVIDELLEVPRAYNPSLKLMAVLLRFASKQHKPVKTVAERVTAAPTLEIPLPVKQSAPKPATPQKAAPSEPAVTPRPVTQHEPAAIPTPEGIAPPASQSAANHNPDAPPVSEPAAHIELSEPKKPLDNLSNEQWSGIMAKIKATNVPLHSVLKHAQPTFDPKEQHLTLLFKYQLHRKKMDDTKQKSALAQVVRAMLGPVAISTDVSKDASPPPLTSDPVVASVAAIMGGGEVIDATI